MLKRATFAGIAMMAALGAFVDAPATAADEINPVEINEWRVPYDGRPRDPFATGGSDVWFVGQQNHYLARLDPATGTFTQTNLNDRSGPHNLIVGKNGIVWYTGNLSGYIGRFDPKTGAIDKIVTEDAGVRDPHTLVFDADESHIWFTAQGSNKVGRLTVATRDFEVIDVPTSRARPYGIAMAPDGTPWIALVGTDKIASVNPETLELTEYEVADGARPRRIAVANDGRVYYVDYRRGYLGRFDPKSGAFHEWALPSGSGSRPYGMAADDHGRIWLVETGPSPNLFIGFDPAEDKVFSVTAIPSGAGSVRHMHYHAGSVWFGTDAGTIGRAVVAP